MFRTLRSCPARAGDAAPRSPAVRTVGTKPPRRSFGFTLLELLIALLILGVLTAVAGPFFYDQIRKSRRSEAFTALSQLQQAQERWRSTNTSYATTLTALGLPAATPNNHYAVAVTAADATSYTLTATAASTSSQAGDAGCQVLAVRMTGGNLGYGSGATAPDWADPARCWAR